MATNALRLSQGRFYSALFSLLSTKKRTKKFSHEVTQRDTKKKNLYNLCNLWFLFFISYTKGFIKNKSLVPWCLSGNH